VDKDEGAGSVLRIGGATMRYRNIIRFGLCLLALVVISGCGEDFPILTRTLEVSGIEVAESSIGVGETTRVKASVDYSGDETVLMYDWTVEAGEIQEIEDRAGEAIYKAPDEQGTYFINVVVSDGSTSDEGTVEIMVGQQAIESLILDRDTHWPAAAHKDKLAYNVNIKKVVSQRVLLHYDITQDQDEFDAFLTIQIGQNIVTVPEEMAIGGEQPSTAKRTVRDIDVSNVITGPGRYMITFYIMPGDRVENGWLMNEAKVIGVEGTSDPQQ
jgi:hypothetical protein